MYPESGGISASRLIRSTWRNTFFLSPCVRSSFVSLCLSLFLSRYTPPTPTPSLALPMDSDSDDLIFVGSSQVAPFEAPPDPHRIVLDLDPLEAHRQQQKKDRFVPVWKQEVRPVARALGIGRRVPHH